MMTSPSSSTLPRLPRLRPTPSPAGACISSSAAAGFPPSACALATSSASRSGIFQRFRRVCFFSRFLQSAVVATRNMRGTLTPLLVNAVLLRYQICGVVDSSNPITAQRMPCKATAFMHLCITSKDEILYLRLWTHCKDLVKRAHVRA